MRFGFSETMHFKDQDSNSDYDSEIATTRAIEKHFSLGMNIAKSSMPHATQFTQQKQKKKKPTTNNVDLLPHTFQC